MKITLKNGKEATLRRIRAKDYDDVMIFFDKFSRGKGAKWTNEYPGGARKKSKEDVVRRFESDKELFLGVWIGKELIGQGCIFLNGFNHPRNVLRADFGLSILEEYTSLGVGTKILKELEKWAVRQKVHRIHAKVRHNNTRGLGLYLKMGYQIEGMARETAFFDNQWQHEYDLAKIVNS